MADLKVNSIADAADSGAVAFPFGITVTGANASTGAVSGSSVSSTSGNVASAAAVTAVTTVTAGTGLVATTGGVTATAGNISAAAGSVSANTTVSAGTSVTATTAVIGATGQMNSITNTAGTGPVSFPQGLGGQPTTLIRLDTILGHGSTNTKIARFTNVTSTTGSDVTYADSATAGASFTIARAGWYAITWGGSYNAATYNGISLNSAQLTTDVLSITAASRLAQQSVVDADNIYQTTWMGPLALNDVIRPHDNGTTIGSLPDRAFLSIARIG
jgi:hypothetical protein